MNTIRFKYDNSALWPVLIVLALGLLSGCGAAKQKAKPPEIVEKKQKSLMERFEEGSPLLDMTPSPMPWHSEEVAPDVTSHVNKAREYELAGKNLLAYNSYAKALSLDPDLLSLRLRMGEVLLKEKHDGRALGEFLLVLEEHPDHARANLGAGIASFNNREYDHSAVYFQKALAADAELDHAHTFMGMIHNYKRRFDQAAECFHSAALLAPNKHVNFNNLGLTYYLSGQYGKAVAAYNEALRLGSPKERTCNNLAMALYRLGKHAEALEAFKYAGDEAAAYNNFAYLFFLDGKYNMAEKYFHMAIEVNPIFYIRAHENLKRVKSAKALGAGLPALLPGQDGPMHAPAEGNPEAEAPKPFTGASADDKGRPETAPEFTAHVLYASLGPDYHKPILPQVGNKKKRLGKKKDKNASLSLPYKLMVGSWETMEAARRHTNILAEDGIVSDILTVNLPKLGLRHRVVIGSHKSFQAAKAAKEQILRDTKLDDICILRFNRLHSLPPTGAHTPKESSTAETVVADPKAVARLHSADDDTAGENQRADKTPRGNAFAL
jgi:Flp pilus assembly protein TadD